MTELAFGGADREMIGLGPQAAAQGPGFGEVTEAGAGGMGLDGAEVGGADAGTAQGIVDGLAGLLPLRFRRDDVMGIAAAAAGEQPAEGGVARGVPGAHQGQHAGPFRQHEAIAIPAVGPGGQGRSIQAGGEGPHRTEAHQTKTVHRRFRAAGDDQVGPIIVEQHLGQHQGFRAGGTG